MIPSHLPSRPHILWSTYHVTHVSLSCPHTTWTNDALHCGDLLCHRGILHKWTHHTTLCNLFPSCATCAQPLLYGSQLWLYCMTGDAARDPQISASSLTMGSLSPTWLHSAVPLRVEKSSGSWRKEGELRLQQQQKAKGDWYLVLESWGCKQPTGCQLNKPVICKNKRHS